jgi:hypothetical protein
VVATIVAPKSASSASIKAALYMLYKIIAEQYKQVVVFRWGEDTMWLA